MAGKCNRYVKQFKENYPQYSGIRCHGSRHTNEFINVSYITTRNHRLHIMVPTGHDWDNGFMKKCVEQTTEICEELVETKYDYNIYTMYSMYDEFHTYLNQFVKLPEISRHPLWYRLFSRLVTTYLQHFSYDNRCNYSNYETFIHDMQTYEQHYNSNRWQMLCDVRNKEYPITMAEYFGAIIHNIDKSVDEFVKKYSYSLSSFCLNVANTSFPRTVIRAQCIIKLMNNVVPDNYIDGSEPTSNKNMFEHMLNTVTIYEQKPWNVARLGKKSQLVLKEEDIHHFIPEFLYSKLIPKGKTIIDISTDNKYDFSTYDEKISEIISRDRAYENSYISSKLQIRIGADVDVEKCITDKEYYTAFVNIVKYALRNRILKSESWNGDGTTNIATARICYAITCVIMLESEFMEQLHLDMFMYILKYYFRHYTPNSARNKYRIKFTDMSNHVVDVFMEAMADEGKVTDSGVYVPTALYRILLENMDTTGCENGKILADKIKYGL